MQTTATSWNTRPSAAETNSYGPTVQAATAPEQKTSIFSVQLGARISQRDVLAVTRQLSVMVKAGIDEPPLSPVG